MKDVCTYIDNDSRKMWDPDAWPCYVDIEENNLPFDLIYPCEGIEEYLIEKEKNNDI